MKLSRIRVDRYGPLAVDISTAEDVHVIYGPNESGKTLLVESLLLMLTGAEQAAGARVDEHPAGFVVCRDGPNEFKLENGETLISWYREQFDRELHPDEFRNVFVIRDADLEITEEDRFYRRVTDQLVGIRTADIETVREALVERGRLTPEKLAISSDQSSHRAGKQLESARQLQAEVREYFGRSDQDGLSAMEARLHRTKAKRDRLEAEIETLEQARAVEEFDRLRELTEQVDSNLGAQRELPDEARLEALESALDDLHAGAATEEAQADRKDRFASVAVWSIIAAAVAFVALLLFADGVVAGTVPVLLLVLAVYSLWRYQRASSQVVSVESARSDVLAEGQRLGIKAADADALRVEVARLQDEQGELAQQVTSDLAVLRDRLGIENEDPATVVDTARAQLETRQRELDLGLERDYSAAALEDAQASLDRVQRDLEEVQRAIREHEQSLQGFAERARDLRFETFTGDSLDLQIANLDALQRLETRLGVFIESIERNADRSRIGIQIFDEMATAENEKVRNLFGRGSEATNLFRQITGGRYTAVEWDHAGGDLVVERETGERFHPQELSKGTRDQLYLSIRVALGRQLLDGQDGFFVMDDAFLTADRTRLHRQAEVLSGLAEAGWQTVYLTAEREAQETIQRVTGAESTELEPLR